MSELAEALTDRGAAVAVFSSSHSSDTQVDRSYELGGVSVRKFYRPRAHIRFAFHDRAVEQALTEYIEAFRPDVVHVHHLVTLTVPVIPLIRQWGYATVLTLHDLWFLCPDVFRYRPSLHRISGDLWGLNCFVHHELGRVRSLGSMIARRDVGMRVRRHIERARLLRKELDAADRIIVPSTYLADQVRQFYPVNGAIVRLPHGIPAFEPPKTRPSRDGVHVGYLGGIVRHKGVDLLVRAFRAVPRPDARLIIRGPVDAGNFRRAVETSAAADPRITIGPSVPRKDLSEFFSSLDLLVVPSRGKESFSVVAHEAIAHRVPVLASNVGALPEIVRPGENGELFTAGDADALARKLALLVMNDDALRRLSAFQPVKGMSEHAAELERIYRDVRPRREGAA